VVGMPSRCAALPGFVTEAGSNRNLEYITHPMPITPTQLTCSSVPTPAAAALVKQHGDPDSRSTLECDSSRFERSGSHQRVPRFIETHNGTRVTQRSHPIWHTAMESLFAACGDAPSRRPSYWP